MLSIPLALLLVAPALAGPPLSSRPPCAPLPTRALPAPAARAPRAAEDAPRGRCVEARTASLLAGACHYGGELATAGRCAVLGLVFEGGATRGQDLSGLELALGVEAPESLAGEAPRRMLVYLEPAEQEARARAALAWLAENGLVGELVGLERASLAIETELEQGEGYRVRVGGATVADAARFELAGARLPDRRCCAMPLAVWYEPLLPFAERVVGASTRFELHEPALGLDFRRGGDNDVFVGRFGPGAVPAHADPAGESSGAHGPRPAPTAGPTAGTGAQESEARER